MPSYLDFDTTRVFRDFILGRTLQQPNGPQTFTASNYVYHDLSNFPNVDPGDVETNRPQELLQTQTSNIYKPLVYDIEDTLHTLPRRANLNLYPYFQSDPHNLIGIMVTDHYDNESELFKFAAHYIKEERNGPVHARIEQNTYAATVGRVRIIDALNGNTATAINLLTGREPLIEGNNKITVSKTIAGKTIDFSKTVAGLELPFSTIPGNYLTDPANPINYRPVANTQAGGIIQDITGALGSLIGVERRPKLDRKPSDLFIEYMGDNQKKELYNLLTFSKYAPNYTTTARSQNSSKVFNFVDRAAQGVKEFLGLEAPRGVAYIGDDRSEDVKYAMGDFYDRPVKSPYYLSLMFDATQAELFQSSKNVGEGGQISGKLTWISKNSKNKLGTNNAEYISQQSNFENSLSTKYGFRENSILGVTQELLDTLPTNGGESRSHVANVIDQTSRVFREGDVRMSRGSAIKYVDKVTGDETGVEYCRVWTKDRPYFSMSDTMKKTANIRKFDDSVLGGTSRVWNINIAPMSDGNKGFGNSSNIVDKYQYGGGFYAKKYMFSIENLAWKSSTSEGFTVLDLPYCERGPNGGRVMWFPPYDLKVSEQNNARWEENTFLGRPEPIYTYQNTSRSGQISFKVVVDHPSVLNLLVREYFRDMTDDDAENYINAFFAGCQDVDLYALVRKFATLDGDDVKLIQRYLNAGVSSEVIQKYKTTTEDIKEVKPTSEPIKTDPVNTKSESNESFDISLNFANDYPKNSNSFKSDVSYTKLYNEFNNTTVKNASVAKLGTDVTTLILGYTANKTTYGNDHQILFGNPVPVVANLASTVTKIQTDLTDKFNELTTKYQEYDSKLTQLKTDISDGKVQTVTFNIHSSTSAVADNKYNMKLSYRRAYSIIIDILEKVSKTSSVDSKVINGLKWDNFTTDDNNKNGESQDREVSFKDLGYSTDGSIKFKTLNYGEKYSNDGLECTGKEFKGVKDLNINAPISFGCRRTKVKMSYSKSITQPTQEDKNITKPTSASNVILTPDGVVKIPSKVKKPPIDVMKRIIMKTLSECYYFKKLEEDSPVAFTALREKLRYFHPAFHSTTPEGLNARLTFLNQCVRPGDTIPIKGVSDDMDLNARNTTFGPPPICVLRVGDFYNSKVVIRDVNITFDDTTWDLNPEGIGVQPMIANVNLQVNFIGGHGLAKPVERLQNALSSNFYANTEMYDERSITTNKTIDGVDSEKYTKEFLEQIQKNPHETPRSTTDVSGMGKIHQGEYIGQPVNTTLSYDTLINDVFEKTKNYVTSYQDAYNKTQVKYGSEITSMFFSSTYRTIKDYTVYQGAAGSPQTTISLFGLYTKGKELNILSRGLKSKMVDNIENNIVSLTKDVFNIKIGEVKIPNSDQLLKPFVSSTIQNVIDDMVNHKPVQDLEKSRNELISALDKVNYIIYYLHDAMIEGEKYSQFGLTGFTYDLLYEKYSSCINFLTSNLSKLTSYIDISIDFNTPSSITTAQTVSMMSVLLKPYRNDIYNLYGDIVVFRPTVEKPIIGTALDKFMVTPSEISFKLGKIPELTDTKTLSFETSYSGEITDADERTNLKNLKSPKVLVTTKLNYYKP